MRPWRPYFHASPVVRKGPIPSKWVSSQDPLVRKFGYFSLYSLIFHPNFSSQAPKFANFQLTSPQICNFSVYKPQIWKFLVHKPPPPLFRGKYQFASPTLRKSRPHTSTWKNVECPPGLTPYYYKFIFCLTKKYRVWWPWFGHTSFIHKGICRIPYKFKNMSHVIVFAISINAQFQIMDFL